jgi:hypothetical protein
MNFPTFICELNYQSSGISREIFDFVNELSQEKCFVVTAMTPIIPQTKPIATMINEILVYRRSRLVKDIKKYLGVIRHLTSGNFHNED